MAWNSTWENTPSWLARCISSHAALIVSFHWSKGGRSPTWMSRFSRCREMSNKVPSNWISGNYFLFSLLEISCKYCRTLVHSLPSTEAERERETTWLPREDASRQFWVKYQKNQGHFLLNSSSWPSWWLNCESADRQPLVFAAVHPSWHWLSAWQSGFTAASHPSVQVMRMAAR